MSGQAAGRSLGREFLSCLSPKLLAVSRETHQNPNVFQACKTDVLDENHCSCYFYWSHAQLEMEHHLWANKDDWLIDWLIDWFTIYIAYGTWAYTHVYICVKEHNKVKSLGFPYLRSLIRAEVTSGTFPEVRVIVYMQSSENVSSIKH